MILWIIFGILILGVLILWTLSSPPVSPVPNSDATDFSFQSTPAFSQPSQQVPASGTVYTILSSDGTGNIQNSPMTSDGTNIKLDGNIQCKDIVVNGQITLGDWSIYTNKDKILHIKDNSDPKKNHRLVLYPGNVHMDFSKGGIHFPRWLIKEEADHIVFRDTKETDKRVAIAPSTNIGFSPSSIHLPNWRIGEEDDKFVLRPHASTDALQRHAFHPNIHNKNYM